MSVGNLAAFRASLEVSPMSLFLGGLAPIQLFCQLLQGPYHSHVLRCCTRPRWEILHSRCTTSGNCPYGSLPLMLVIVKKISDKRYWWWVDVS